MNRQKTSCHVLCATLYYTRMNIFEYNNISVYVSFLLDRYSSTGVSFLECDLTAEFFFNTNLPLVLACRIYASRLNLTFLYLRFARGSRWPQFREQLEIVYGVVVDRLGLAEKGRFVYSEYHAMRRP